MRYIGLVILILVMLLGNVAHARVLTCKVKFQFGSQTLYLDSAYVTPLGDTLHITGLKFYVSSWQLHNAKGWHKVGEAHLVDIEEERSTHFNITQVPSGSYDSIRLVIGVDSLYSTNGAHSGDLDPMKGMYWAWNTGYIMAKMEGKSNVCNTLHHAFEYHIGGYMHPNNAARTVQFPLLDLIVGGKSGVMQPNLQMDVNAAQWFANGVDIKQTNSILIPGAAAMKMADNYSNMLHIYVAKQ